MTSGPEQRTIQQHEAVSADTRIRDGADQVYQLLGQASDQEAEGVIGKIRDYVQPGGLIEQELEALESSRREVMKRESELVQQVIMLDPHSLQQKIDAIESSIVGAIKQTGSEFVALATEKIQERDMYVVKLRNLETLKGRIDQVNEQLLVIDVRIEGLADEVSELKSRTPELLAAAERYHEVRSSVKQVLGGIALSDHNQGWKRVPLQEDVQSEKIPTVETTEVSYEIPRLPLDLPASVLASVQPDRDRESKRSDIL